MQHKKKEYPQGGGGQIGVLMLELSIQRQSPLVLVGREQRGEVHHLGEGEPCGDGAPVPEKYDFFFNK